MGNLDRLRELEEENARLRQGIAELRRELEAPDIGRGTPDISPNDSYRGDSDGSDADGDYLLACPPCPPPAHQQDNGRIFPQPQQQQQSRALYPQQNDGAPLEQTSIAVDPGPISSHPDLSNTGDGVLSRRTSNGDTSGSNASHQHFTPPNLDVGFRVPGCDVRPETRSYHEPWLNLDETLNQSQGLPHRPISWMNGMFPGHPRTAPVVISPHLVL